MKEIWKDIDEYKGLYQVSNLGMIKSLLYSNQYITKIQSKILKQEITKENRCQVTLYKDNISKRFRVHQLVAKAFVPNPNNLKEINHKDENPLNNKADNLEWCTHKYNCNYGSFGKRISKKLSVPVYQYSKNKIFVKKWNSINEASKFYNTKHISCVCKGLRKTAKNFIWSYEEL